MIRLDNVTKEYDLPPGQPGQLVAADRLTMEVAAGEVFGLVGPNGAGKTTTLKMICGLDEPASGLDPKARLELKDLIRRLNREGKTIFITSHVLSDLEEICTSLAIMEKGKLLRVGKIADVMRGAGMAKRVRIRLAAPGFALAAWLASQPGVSEIK